MKLATLCLLLATMTCSHDSQLWNEYDENSGQPGLLEQVLQDHTEKNKLGVQNILVHEDYFLMGFHIGRERAKATESTLSIASGQDERVGEAVRDFCQKNMSESVGPKLTEGEIAFPLLTEEGNEYLYGVSGAAYWERLSQRFPEAKQMVYLSQPGYSIDGETAMIYLAAYWPDNAGSGGTYIYRYSKGKWKFARNDLGPSWKKD